MQVAWEVATDPACAKVVRRGTEEAVRDWAHSVHVEVTGLEPGREYWYRFKAGSYVSLERIRKFSDRLEPYAATIQVKEFRAYLDAELAS